VTTEKSERYNITGFADGGIKGHKPRNVGGLWKPENNLLKGT
jgi:hypothetical protein